MSADNSTPIERYWLCPLYSFDCYSETVNLAEGIEIKRASKELKKTLLDYVYHGEHYLQAGQWDDPSVFEWMALLPYRPKVSGVSDIENRQSMFEENHRAINLLDDFVTALRLCHKGMVTPGPLTTASMTIWTSLSKNGWSGEPKYELDQSDVTKVNKILEEIRACRRADKFSVLDETLGRFNSAYYGWFKDRLIDQMIAFESLYIGDDKELGYKLALRTAFLLAQDEDEIKAIFSDMKKAYDLRSKVVHGSKQVQRLELNDITPKTEEYLRHSIRKFLSLLLAGYSLDNLKKGKNKRLAKLDENIFSNGRLLTLKE